VSPRSAAPRPRRALLPALLAGLALLATACSGSPSAAPDTRSWDPGVREVALEVDGRDRSYVLEPATGLAPGEPSAVVVVLHQEGGTPEGVAQETGLAGLRARGATLVYPAGVDRSWSAGACCGTPRDEGVDDLAFVDALLADVAEQGPVDPDRTALVGYSSGGMLAYRYVCGRPGRLAAAVVVSGSLESPCEGSVTAPDVLAVHGRLDGTVGFDKPVFITALGLAPRPAVDTLDILTRGADCAAAPRTTALPDAEQSVWQECRGGDVEAVAVSEAGHGWGGLDATRRTSEFLLQHLLDQ